MSKNPSPEPTPERLLAAATAAYTNGAPEQAIALCQQLTRKAPRLVKAWVLLGMAHRRANQAGQAILAYNEAIKIDPGTASVYNNLGNVMRDLDLYSAALPQYHKAIGLDPLFHEAYYNLGCALLALGRHEEGLIQIKTALQMAPNYADAHWDLALALLRHGNYGLGFAEYEWRFRRPQANFRRFAQPRWQGENFAGKTLLLHVEQGLGDVIQFLRFIPQVQARGGSIILEVRQELLVLAQQLPGLAACLVMGQPLPPHDLQFPLLSLGSVLDVDLRHLAATVPYLRAPAESVSRWGRRLGDRGRRPRVGMVWAGSPTFQTDRLRSPRLRVMLPLLEFTEIDFFGLQLGDGRKDLADLPLPPNFTDLGPEIHDLADTAAIMNNLDLVISSDSAPVHLAGALGVPTWVLLPHIADWRWLTWRRDSPWYPSLRLYRQASHGDWHNVVMALKGDLADWLAARP